MSSRKRNFLAARFDSSFVDERWNSIEFVSYHQWTAHCKNNPFLDAMLTACVKSFKCNGHIMLRSCNPDPLVWSFSLETWNFKPEFLLASYSLPSSNERLKWLNQMVYIVSRKYTAKIHYFFSRLWNDKWMIRLMVTLIVVRSSRKFVLELLA